MQKYLLFLTIIILVHSMPVWSQISQGGYPLSIPNLKSVNGSSNVVKLPSFDMNKELLKSVKAETHKSLHFAHSFDVDLTPFNSGSWTIVDGYRVWSLTIKSVGAHSLNVIFKNYKIPTGARLYVFDKNRESVLGAFTSQNNKSYKRFAIYPVPGDELNIQYEEPVDAAFEGELEIESINHDFIGILNLKNRWERRPSGSCNIDVNCETASGLENEKRAVVRILAKDELGTGTLLNNTLNDGKPYLISAFHVFDDEKTAEVSLYDFNYESPYCTKIEGSDVQTVSGSKAVASYDSLDFILVELSEMPPATYRPYFAGWSALHEFPSNSYTVHHPNGDVKKISHDTGTCDSLYYNSALFLKYAHWKVFNWETGTTEGGSSGAGLFNKNQLLVGTLSGGNASCTELLSDAFARFDLMWDHMPDIQKQLKHWLDYDNTGLKFINGLDPYLKDKSACTVLGNFQTEDIPSILPENSNSGFYTGNNSMGITEIVEKFSGLKSADISGISIGIKKCKYSSANPNLIVRIYSGDSVPQFAEKQYIFSLSKVTDDAMNYFNLNEPISIKGNFFVGIVLPNGGDSILFYQSQLRSVSNSETMLLKHNGQWKYLSDVVGKKQMGASLLMQATICNASFEVKIDTTFQDDSWLTTYPNPATDNVVVELAERTESFNLSIYDMTGKLKFSDCYTNARYAEINISQLMPGIYILRAENGIKTKSARLIIY